MILENSSSEEPISREESQIALAFACGAALAILHNNADIPMGKIDFDIRETIIRAHEVLGRELDPNTKQEVYLETVCSLITRGDMRLTNELICGLVSLGHFSTQGLHTMPEVVAVPHPDDIKIPEEWFEEN